MFIVLPERKHNYNCSKCKLVALLEEKIQGLWAHLSTLHFVREGEEFMDRTREALLRGQQEAEGKVSQQMEERPTQEEGTLDERTQASTP